MEVALKERLVGAVVLVALGVWLIPLFLDGPDGERPTGSQPLTLPVPASPKPDRTTKTIKLTGVTPSAPTPVTSAPVQSPQPTTPEPAVAQPQPMPEPVKSTSPPKRSPAAVSGWFVQLGSFGSEANAKRLAAQVSALGWDAQLSQVAAGGKTMHRVRVGPVPTRSKADALRGELAQRGFDGKVMNET